MNVKNALISTLLCGLPVLTTAQIRGFENEIPQQLRAEQKSVKLSSTYYKQGSQSLEWKFAPQEKMEIDLDEVLVLDEEKEYSHGIQLWVYNEKPSQDSLRFEFYGPDGKVSYEFAFHLRSAGWRACWINFLHMKGDKQNKQIAGCRFIAPGYRGRLFLDRMTLPISKYNARTTPDLQMPLNNSLTYRDLWHWCRTWQWEQYKYDIPLEKTVTAEQQKDLRAMEKKLTDMILEEEFPKGDIRTATELFRNGRIAKSGRGYVGAPVVAPDDDLDSLRGDYSLNNVDSMLAGFASEYYYRKSKAALKKYFEVWDYILDQGFAYGSGMGTNHHYGYQVHAMYATAWILRDEIFASRNRDNIISALQYWSALSETRKTCQKNRDELLDTWHTLLTPKMISALMFVDERERVRAMKGLSRWVATSLAHTPGTLGGVKVDGTTFHHGGFYPAYTIGSMATVGRFVHLVNGTSFALPLEARKVLRQAVLALRNYSTKYEWGIGICGRHPFGRYRMEQTDVATLAHLAMSGDFSGMGRAFDYDLAADYLRLCDSETPEAAYFRSQGVKPAEAPEGFFVYNYGSAGIYRCDNWMVTLKGYNTDVWGAEIYVRDNRYGRYQSYGSAQLFTSDSNASSGYLENGWDWNRLPGTTTIHLPFEMLNSPLRYSTMLRSKENFSGASALEGKNGMFAMKLMEGDLKNFTPDHVARKSVFCFDNRLVCLGTGISNSNAIYPTETTLFQLAFNAQKESVLVDGKQHAQVGFIQDVKGSAEKPGVLRDNYGNYYYVKNGDVKVQIAEQHSFHNKLRTPTKGVFASAWIHHGHAPKDASYEYLVLVQPSEKDLDTCPDQSYEVLQCDAFAHGVYDKATGITGYAAFEALTAMNDAYLSAISRETMVMYRMNQGRIVMSVCDPNLNISEKTYTTPAMSCPVVKTVTLQGRWKLASEAPAVKCQVNGEQTVLTITCIHGVPQEFILSLY